MGLAEHNATPYLGMALATTAQAGLIVISKSALSSGMSNYSFVAYSNALAALILLPLSLLLHRSSNRPPLTFLMICGFFFLGVLGCLAQLSGYTGISYSSAEFASAMLNLIPGFTFVLAVICRMEEKNWRSWSFMAKTIGTLISIGGAFVATLYKGPQISTYEASSMLHHNYVGVGVGVIAQSSLILGALFMSGDCAFSAGYIILQASVLKKYPAELIVVFFYLSFAAILSALVSLVTDRDLSAWSLQPNIRLAAVLYSGVFGSAFRVSVTAWCLHKKGPLFVAMFYPLSIVINAVVDIVFMDDILYFGSLAGSIIIVIGFYSVMWGKANEVKVIDNDFHGTSATTNTVKAPLLQIHQV